MLRAVERHVRQGDARGHPSLPRRASPQTLPDAPPALSQATPRSGAVSERSGQLFGPPGLRGGPPQSQFRVQAP